MTPLQLLGAFIAAFLAGGINSVAGGGSMISFPILLALGLPPITANATNTAGIWSGAIGSIWGFREELGRVPKNLKLLLIPALVGGLIGAVLLKYTSAQTFDRIIPFLILFSTILFIVQAPIQAKLRSRESVGTPNRSWVFLAVSLQLVVAIYGGYFGAGMSIMMLSILGIIGMTEMLEMTAMTSLLSMGINGISGLFFIVNGLVVWHLVIVMAIGAVVGGYAAAGVARKIGKVMIRRFVILVGFAMATYMLTRIVNR